MTPPPTLTVARRTELISPGPAEALAGILDIQEPAAAGDTLPPLWHWIYLLQRPPQRELGPDGHPTRGIPEPPGPGQLRMFAGGRVTTHRELRFAEPATRTTSVLRSADKQGRSGRLTFVTVRSDIEQTGELVIAEEHDIVYRRGGPSLTPNVAAPAGPERNLENARSASLSLDVDEVLLFRFSALTYNAHRIHYDRDYAVTEGYPDLVIHGPLQALLMGQAMRRSGVPMLGRQFAYRLVAPTFGVQRLAATAWRQEGGVAAQVRDQAGTITATSNLTAVPESSTARTGSSGWARSGHEPPDG